MAWVEAARASEGARAGLPSRLVLPRGLGPRACELPVQGRPVQLRRPSRHHPIPGDATIPAAAARDLGLGQRQQHEC
eukprot:28806-Pyramimonas_sp.AAC.1